MEVTYEKVEDNKVKLDVEVGVTEVQKAIERAYKTVANSVNIPGFRKGKIPPKIIDARIGKDVVLKEALENILPVAYAEAVAKSRVKPIDNPEIKVEQFEEDMPLKFTAVVEVQPEVKLPEYESVQVEKKKLEVTEEEVMNQLERLRERFAKLEQVATRPANTGDFVLISFTGYVDGKENENASATDFLVEIGSNTLMPQFEQELVGTRAGDIKEFTITFPPDHHQKEIAGKPVRFRVIVKEVKQKVLPELNEEFAKEIGDFESLEEVKNLIREKLQAVKEAEAESIWQSDVLEEFSSKVDLTVPEKMIQNELEQMLTEVAYNLANQGFSLQQYLEMSGKTVEDLKNEMKKDAEKRVKTRLVLEAVAEKENLKVSKEDLDNELKLIAERVGRTPEEVEKILKERNELSLLAYDILVRKAFQHLVEKVRGLSEEEEEKKSVKKARSKSSSPKSSSTKSSSHESKEPEKKVEKQENENPSG